MVSGPIAPAQRRVDVISTKNPYDWLYIYYLEGCLKKGTTPVGDAFIGNWEEDGQSFLFFKKPCPQKIRDLLKIQPQLKLQDEYRMSYEEWHGGTVQPLRIGNIRVLPPWTTSTDPLADGENPKADSRGNVVDILLDPGVVFGNGTHPTTHHCVEALDILFSMDRLDTVLDLGTGTGLLAVVAVKRGCRRALAVDLNLLAVQTAKKNVELNHLDEQVLAVQGNAKNFVDLSSDLVISNIHYDVMKQLIGSKGFLRKKYFILSGLLRNQATQIENLLYQYPVSIIDRWEYEGVWYSYLGRIA
jgi:ribosomal protein L11 methyltransferase